MLEYYVIRVILALAIIYLLRFELPFELQRYLKFMAFYQLLPQAIFSPLYWRSIWLPLEMVQIVLAWQVSTKLFALATDCKTYWWERVNILIFGACIGGAFILLTWQWHPANEFQAMVLISQYYHIGLFTGWSVIFAWFWYLRPIGCTSQVIRLIMFWSVWLACQCLMSLTGRSCLLWTILNPSNGLWWSRLITDISMLVQTAFILWCSMYFRSVYGRQQPTT